MDGFRECFQLELSLQHAGSAWQLLFLVSWIGSSPSLSSDSLPSCLARTPAPKVGLTGWGAGNFSWLTDLGSLTLPRRRLATPAVAWPTHDGTLQRFLHELLRFVPGSSALLDEGLGRDRSGVLLVLLLAGRFGVAVPNALRNLWKTLLPLNRCCGSCYLFSLAIGLLSGTFPHDARHTNPCRIRTPRCLGVMKEGLFSLEPRGLYVLGSPTQLYNTSVPT